MIMNLCRVIENETPSAIGAVGFTRLTDRQVDHGMTERAAAAIASDSRRFHVNDLGWLHLSRSYVFPKALGLIYRAARGSAA
ncbi:MAG TPA: hypothetical protein VKP60_14015 [Magnetospirillaceae bacterium]|nr:hypothetical protein [Magnetospirillaceae bacterium]